MRTKVQNQLDVRIIGSFFKNPVAPVSGPPNYYSQMMDRHLSTKSNFLSSSSAKYRFVSCRLQMDRDSRPTPSFWTLALILTDPCNIIISHKIHVIKYVIVQFTIMHMKNIDIDFVYYTLNGRNKMRLPSNSQNLRFQSYFK